MTIGWKETSRILVYTAPWMNETLQHMVWWLWRGWHLSVGKVTEFFNCLGDMSERQCYHQKSMVNARKLKSLFTLWFLCFSRSWEVVSFSRATVFCPVVFCVLNLSRYLAVVGWRLTSGMQTACCLPGSLLRSPLSLMRLLQWNLEDAPCCKPNSSTHIPPG